jgi:tRNA nucleotidyltransferase/poly(A) polymerase
MLSIKIDTGKILDLAILLQRAVANTQYEGSVFLAGGSIRDALLGQDPSDFDLVVPAPNKPLELAQHFYNTGLSTKPQQFKRRGVVALHIKRMPVEISQIYTQGQSWMLDGEVDRDHYLLNDALRRDFTINSLYCRIDDLEALDPTGLGRQDIDNRIIRSVLDPYLCFNDDPLRMLRAIRLSISLNAPIEITTWNAILSQASSINLVARERVKEERTKILKSDKWTDGLMLLKKSGLLLHICSTLDGYITDIGINTLSKRFTVASIHKNLALDSLKLRTTLLTTYLYEMTIQQNKNLLPQEKILQAIYHDNLCCLNLKKTFMVQVTNIVAFYIYLKDRLGKESDFDAFDLINAAICLKDDTLILEALLRSADEVNHDKKSKRLFVARLDQLHKHVSKLSNHKLPITGTNLISQFPGIPQKAIGCMKNLALMIWLSSEQISTADLINRLREVSDDCQFRCPSCTTNECDNIVGNSWAHLYSRIQKSSSIHTDLCLSKER